MKLREMAALAGMTDYGAVSTAIRHCEKRLGHVNQEQEQWNQLCHFYNIQM
jgi:hypothetical protein